LSNARGVKMRKGRIIIDFESDDKGECSWNISREGKDKLNDENLKSLLETVLRDLMSNEF
jgi:hypothetical protein